MSKFSWNRWVIVNDVTISDEDIIDFPCVDGRFVLERFLKRYGLVKRLATLRIDSEINRTIRFVQAKKVPWYRILRDTVMREIRGLINE